MDKLQRGPVETGESSPRQSLYIFLSEEEAAQCVSGKCLWSLKLRSEPGDRRGDGAGKLPDFRLTLASVQPAELLQLVETHGCVTDLTFHPSKTLLAVACEGDQGAGSSGRYGISAGSSSRQILGLVSLESTM